MTEKNKAKQDYMCKVMEGYCIKGGVPCCYARVDDNNRIYCALEKDDADNE